MEPPLQSLTLFLLCIVFLISASILVDSQSQDSSLAPQSLTPPPPPPPPPPVKVGSNKPIHEKHHQRIKWRQRRHTRPRKQKLNTGKTVGLFFAGVAAALQLVVAAFLLLKRRQLLLNINNDN